MRAVLSRRIFFASSHLAGRSAARLPCLPAPCGHASRFPFEIHRIPQHTAVTAAVLLSPSRNVHGVAGDAPKPLPSDLAVGFSSEMERSRGVPPAAEEEEGDGRMNEFLSRFAWMMRQKLVDAFPDSSRETLDEMLLIVAQKVTAELEKGGGVLPSVLADPSIDFSPDLWRTVWEVSKSAFEETRRTRRRQEMGKFLHCDDVKEMCRFASKIGIRGDMLRELRFKWAHEKLEESEFYRNLERIRENAAAGELLGEGENPAEMTEEPTLLALPERKGKLKYEIHGLDLSRQSWAEVADKIHQAEDKIHQAEERIAPEEEPQPIMGKCKLVTEEILTLKGDVDPAPLLAKWVELLQPRRADWLALLGRIHERNPDAYFKVAELVLIEESFQAAIGDYSKLMDAYAKANCVEDAERIYQKMTQKGIDVDTQVLVILLQMYCNAGILDRAKEVFERLRSHGFRPDLKTYKSMIVAYVNVGLLKDAEALMREMEARDIKPTLDIYMVLLQSFAQCGLVDSAQRLFNTMQFSGFPPNLEACTLLIEMYGRAGDPNQARHSFDFLIRIGHIPDDQCVASMIAAYQKDNLLDKALDLLLNMEKDGFKPGIATYTVFVDWLGKLLLVDEVEQILDKIAELGDVPFQINVSLCDMYSRSGDKNKALKCLQIVEGRKEMLSAEQFDRVINGLLDGGFVEHAKRIHGTMQACGFSPSESLSIKLMSSGVSRRRPTALR